MMAVFPFSNIRVSHGNTFATLKQKLSTEASYKVGPIDRFRYFLLAADPGMMQLKHAAKTVLAVVIALEAFRFLHSQAALYAGMSAGFLMQSTAGNHRRTRQISMALMGAASTVAVGVGSELSGQHLAKELLLVAAAFAAFYVRRFIPGKAMFPMFAFVLTLLATLQPGGAGAALPMMTAVFGGFLTAFAVYFYLLPDESLRAFRHSVDLFVFRLQHARRNPGHEQGDLRVLHRAVAFEEEEREVLGRVACALCSQVLADQYEALQILIVLFDIEGQADSGASQQMAARFTQDYLSEITSRLEQDRMLLDA